MKIRSITVFTHPGWPLDGGTLSKSGALNSAACAAITSEGYEVQTSRLATPPFPSLLPTLGAAAEFAASLESAAKPHGFDYVSIGPANPDMPDSYAAIPDVLAATENVFAAGILASAEDGLSLASTRACAHVIARAASITPDGFTNLRFAALANVPPGAPFFPAAYHHPQAKKGDRPAFALATEAADLAVEAVTGSKSLTSARASLVGAVEEHARRLTGVGEQLAVEHEADFTGIDFSFAPFPEEAISIGAALERLGIPAIGKHGSLAAAAFLTEAIDRADFQRVGFSGLFLPVLEDPVLAARAGESLSVNEILLYSAVCGTGLDTIPLPGDTKEEQIAPVLLDLAALAQRLNKPLTARLMPIPGKFAGDPIHFDFAYFADSRVLSLNAEPLSGLFNGNETIAIKPRGK